MTELTKEEHDKIFRDDIVTKLDLVEPAVGNPKAIILAGQPGAGKGRLVTEATRELDGRVVVVDPDQMRDYYPNTRDLKAAKPYSWADDTHADASKWAVEFRSAAIDQRKNLIIDTTLGKYESGAKLVTELREKGYEVEVRALATHRLESELGVETRFSRTMATEGHGRYVPASIQEQVYSKLPDNLDQLQTKNDVRIRIFNRECDELYDSKDPRHQGTAPSAALEAGRAARLDDITRSTEIAKGWQEQATWHATAPKSLESVHGIETRTIAKFVEERQTFGVVERLDKGTAQAQANLVRLTAPVASTSQSQEPGRDHGPGPGPSSPGSGPSSSNPGSQPGASGGTTAPKQSDTPSPGSASHSPSGGTVLNLDNTSHPDHAIYKQALGHVHELDKAKGHTPDERSANLAAALTVAARSNGMERIDRIALDDKGTTVVAAQGQVALGNFDKFARVDTVKGLNAPMAETSAKWPQAMETFRQQQQPQTQTPTQPQQAQTQHTGRQ
jgi:predicted ABC-type ATPase